MRIARLFFGWIAGNRDYLTLLIVAGVAAWLYAQGAIARAERDRVTNVTEQICAAAGSELQPVRMKAKDLGKACRATVLQLAAFRRDTAEQTAATLIDAMKRRDTKQQTDISTAIRAAADARYAAMQMEKADAAVSNDLVGAAWFDALNRSGGLRAPSR